MGQQNGRRSSFVRLKPEKSNFETDNEKIFNITELAMLRVMTMMTGELDATDLLLNFSDFNFRNSLKEIKFRDSQATNNLYPIKLVALMDF